MKLTRSQALELVLALNHYATLDQFQRTCALIDTTDLLKEFLCSEPVPSSAEEDVHCCEVGEDDESEAEESETEEDDDEVDDADDEIVSDDSITAIKLHNLSLQKVTIARSSLTDSLQHLTSVALSFEHIEDDEVDLLIEEGEETVDDIDFIKRTKIELSIHERGVGWHTFDVSKFNRDWTSAIKANKTYGVTY